MLGVQILGFIFALVILFIIFFYIIPSIILALFIQKKWKRSWLTIITLIILALIPTWDVILGSIAYYQLQSSIPKVAIYETAETDGIYYDLINTSVYNTPNIKPVPGEIQVSSITSSGIFKKGFVYGESKVTHDLTGVKPFQISARYYRCEPLAKDPVKTSGIPTRCFQIDRPKSDHMVQETRKRIGTATIHSKKVYDGNKLIGEYQQLCKEDPFPIPFFLWVFPYYRYNTNCKPAAVKEYTDFEFRVLKAKRNN